MEPGTKILVSSALVSVRSFSVLNVFSTESVLLKNIKFIVVNLEFVVADFDFIQVEFDFIEVELVFVVIDFDLL